MNAPDHRAQLQQASARLDEISGLLASEQTDDSQAVELAREAAEIAAEVGAVAGEAARAASESQGS